MAESPNAGSESVNSDTNELSVESRIAKEYETKEKAARSRVIAQARENLKQVGMTFADAIEMERKRKRAPRTPAVAKYQSPDGKKWPGNGRPPKWIREHEEAGGNRDDFLIK
jgi:DNA-binding protein H-NS